MNQNKLFDQYNIIGENIKNYINRYKNVLGLNATVLITGETGTGKELIARWLHFNDPERCNKPLVKITIPNIGENIFESEVFGYEKGAFTGAISSKKGLIEVAEDGTVFLDEIENASPSVQSKLLQLLEDRVYRKVGDTVYRKTGARFVIATNKDLYQEVIRNTFRSDLFYRLAVFEIKIPPLRERGRDLLEIANHFVKLYSIETGKDLPELKEAEYRLLSAYDWPGNVRELKNMIERAVIFSEKGKLDFSLLPGKTGTHLELEDSLDLRGYIRHKERDFLENALKKCKGDVQRTAELINMSIPFVYKKIREYKIGL